ncbi:MAG: hypothetical protein WCN88_02450 [Candidatus Falkowbacteria bacterium]
MKKNKQDEGGLWTAKFSEVVTSLQVLEKNGFTREMLDCLRGTSGNSMAQEIIALFYNPSLNSSFYKSRVEEWERFYKKYFDIEVNLSKIKVQRPWKEFSRLVIIVPKIPLFRIISVMEKRFSVIIDPSDHSVDATINQREGNSVPYAIWVHDGEEPEVDHRGHSAAWMSNCPKESETLVERLIHGLKYWDEHKKHMDITMLTLCSGSQSVLGLVPCVSCLQGYIIQISWVKPSYSHAKVGPREVISCDE